MPATEHKSDESLTVIDGNSVPTMLACSHTLAGQPYLRTLLSANIFYAWPWHFKDASAVLAWGNKERTARAGKLALKLNLPLLRAEDGFLRSVGHGKRHIAYSIALDRIGIYYDASCASDLENLVKLHRNEQENDRAHSLICGWREARISKYNHAPDAGQFLEENKLHAPGGKPFVLVIDQTFDDASVHYGMADRASFQKMLDAALMENPDCHIVIKIHPEVACGRKRGYFDDANLPQEKRLIFLKEDLHPASLLEHAKSIYTVTSQLGFEALLWNKPVRTFGMPFYAGWGLTRDDMPSPERRCPVPLENLVYSALVDYVRYLDPETGKPCTPERLIEWLALQRRMRTRFPEKVFALKFPFYKRRILRRFVQGSEIRFVERIGMLPKDAVIAVWGAKNEPETLGRTTIRVEDGFIRSVGLGADLVTPLSLIMDRNGIHYDPNSPSELEHILQESVFSQALLNRARALIDKVIDAGITKYNVGKSPDTGWKIAIKDARSSGKRVILVPGQVESDASIRYGARIVKRNADLLCRVRVNNPDAYVLFKHHPDVLAGLRSGSLDATIGQQLCNQILKDVSVAELLPLVDEVHTLTSLSGFEALLRGKKVVCYGQPFYAGWGLTQDVDPLKRRTRRLSLLELVAGALILYPTYISRTTKMFTTPERTIEELCAWRKQNTERQWWRTPLRLFLTLRKY